MANSEDNLVSINELNSQYRYYKRLQVLSAFYVAEFGMQPDFFVRVPGRVNLIGEHVDYCGYPVLPMAIDLCIILAVGVNKQDQQLHLRNIEKFKFQNYDCDLEHINIELPKTGAPAWYKYYLCGIKGIYDALGAKRRILGMNIAISGNVPPGSGLSSSSALVSAAVLATAHIQGMPLERKNLATISACCECYIGTQSGGMDQAIAYLAKKGCAQFIEFHPKLNATPVELPAGACFVVANSLAESHKAASSYYNERVVECRLGARWLAKCSQLRNWRDTIRLVELQDALKCNLMQLEQLTNEHLTQDQYTRDDICQNLAITEQELEQQFLTPNTQHMQYFKLRQRTLHVIQESMRVLSFRAICDEQNATATDTANLDALAELLQQSHQSLKELYECSHIDLNRLVAISAEMGIPARLTGAGWGGCIVALCDSIESSEKYIHVLKQKYFAQLPVHLLQRYQPNDFKDVVFATFPCSGAEILRML